jgi:hypothetical protein
MIIYCLFFTVVFFTNYFKWKVAIESKFKNYSSFDELFSILLIIISCYILYIWTLFYVSIGIKSLENSVYYILYSIALIIIFYGLKIIILRKENSNIKVPVLLISTVIELIIMILIGVDAF